MAGDQDRLDAIESRAAIADLVHGYARAMRNGRPEEAVALFAPDGVFEIGQGLPGHEPVVGTRLEGAEHLLAYVSRGDGESPPVCPMIHNLMIEVDGDSARANSVMETPVLGTMSRIIGEYHDSFRREGGRWRFAARRYVIFRER